MSYWSRSFPGHASCLSEVRRFAAAVVGDRPGADLVVAAVSELAANAVLHTASGEPGGQFVVHLASYSDRWQVRVDDGGGPGVPRICTGAGADGAEGSEDGVDCLERECGRGLFLVASLARSWGVLGDEYARAVWAEIPHPRPDDEGDDAAAGSDTPERVDAHAGATPDTVDSDADVGSIGSTGTAGVTVGAEVRDEH